MLVLVTLVNLVKESSTPWHCIKQIEVILFIDKSIYGIVHSLQMVVQERISCG